MKKKLLVIGAIVLALAALGFVGYKFVYPKYVEKSNERKEQVVKEKVIEEEKTSGSERLMTLFVEWMNNEDRTKAKLVDHEGVIYAVVTHYNEDGSITEKVYDEQDVVEYRKQKAKELGVKIH